MKMRNYLTIAIVVLVASAGSFFLGLKSLSYTFSEEYDAVQAMLSFNHLRRYEVLLGCLEGGRVEQASEKLRMSIIDEKELIAKFLNSHESERINEYISRRYPQGIDVLRNYKSDRGSRYTEPTC